jgi:PKD domain-containing protein/PASTA domain-containing protein
VSSVGCKMRVLIASALAAAGIACLPPAGASALGNGDPCSPFWTQATAPSSAFSVVVTSSQIGIHTGDMVTINGTPSTAGTAHRWTWVAGDAACEATSTQADPISNYSVDFGDGASASSSGTLLDHVYQHAGVYPVTLTVTEQNCQGGASAHCFTDSSEQDVTVLDRPPTASFSAGTSSVAGAPVSFDASASADPDGTIATYHWEFGDGHTQDASSPTTTHSFLTGGQKDVVLTVTDDSGSTDTEHLPVSVERRCVVPDVVGMRQGAARTLIEGRDCALGTVKRRRAGERRRHRVLAQSVTPGSVLSVGTPIDLKVGR